MATNDPRTGQSQPGDINFGIDTPVRGAASGGSASGSASGGGMSGGSSSMGTGSSGSSGVNSGGASSGANSGAGAVVAAVRPLQDQARDVTGQAKQAASSAVDQATATAQQVKEQVGQQAAEAARMLREKATTMLSDQKTRASSTLDDLGNAIHAAGCRLEKDNDDAIAGYVHGAADQVRVLSSYLKDKPVESLVGDMVDLARRRPEYFVGGMFVVGLALARFAKSSATQTPSSTLQYRSTQYGSRPYGSQYGSSYQYGSEHGSQYRSDDGSQYRVSNPPNNVVDPYASRVRTGMGGGDPNTGGQGIVNPYVTSAGSNTGSVSTTPGVGVGVGSDAGPNPVPTTAGPLPTTISGTTRPGGL